MIALRHPRPSNLFVSRSLALALSVWGATAAIAQPTAEPAIEQEQETETGLKTVAVAALSGYDSLLGDISYLGELVGRPGAGDMLEGLIAMFAQGRDVEAMGLDKSRPIGVVLQTDGMQFVPIVCLPIADLDKTLEVVEAFGMEPVDAGDGVIELELPQQTLFLKATGGWTYAAQSPDAFDSIPANPEPMLRRLVNEYDLGIRVKVPNVPGMYRQIAIQALQQGMEQGLEQQDEEDDETFELRTRLARLQIEQLTDAIDGLDELTVGWSLDSEAKKTYLDASFTVLPDSKLIRAVETYDNTTTRFAGFHHPEAMLSALASGTTPPEMIEEQREQLEAMVAMFRKQGNKALDEQDEIPNDETREALRSAMTDLIDAYEEMILSGRADIGGSLDWGDEGFALVAGGAIPSPEKIESALRHLAEAVAAHPEIDETPEVLWNAYEHAGVKLHQLVIPVPEQGQARDLFGEELSLTVGIGEGAVYFAAGQRGAENLKKAIDTSRSRDGEKILPFEMVLSVKQLIDAIEPFADNENRQGIEMVAAALADVPEGTDHVRISGRPIKNGMTIRYEAEEGVLRAAGQAAMAAQQAAAAAGEMKFHE